MVLGFLSVAICRVTDLISLHPTTGRNPPIRASETFAPDSLHRLVRGSRKRMAIAPQDRHTQHFSGQKQFDVSVGLLLSLTSTF